MSSEWRAQWVRSICDINKCDWEKIFGSSVIKGYDFFSAMENSRFFGVEYYYLIVSFNERIDAILPCFTYELDLLDLLTGKKLKSIIKAGRKIIPEFFKIRTFVIGSYAATVEDFVGVRYGRYDIEYQTLYKIIHDQVKMKCEEVHSSIVFVKDVRESNKTYVEKILPNYSFFSSFPSNIIPLCNSCRPYPVALKKKKRQRVRKNKEAFDKDFFWEIVKDFSEYTKVFSELYLNVFNEAKNKFERLNDDFFANVNKYLQKQSFLLIARDCNGLIRVMELVIDENDRLLPIYLGINYMQDDTRVLYLNTIFKTIDVAQEMGRDLVDLGQTSYYPKVMSGAFVENLYYGFFSSNMIVNFLIKNAFGSLFPPVDIPDHVYLDAKKNEVIAFLEAKGLCLMNT